MPRTAPRLKDLHTLLRQALECAALEYRESYPNRALAMVWGHRSLAEQGVAYRRGASRIDGVRRFSRHNYPAGWTLAADLWPYVLGDQDPGEYGIVEAPPGRRPRGIILTAAHDLVGDEDLDGDGDIDRRDVKLEFERWGEVVRRAVVLIAGDAKRGVPERRGRLQWGGDWKNFYDGPHVQLADEDAVWVLQALLRIASVEMHDQELCPGPMDGRPGPKTRAAVRAAARHAGLRKWRHPGSALPARPDLWGWLNERFGPILGWW